MFSLTDYQFWLSLVAILISFVIAFYVPGRVVLGKIKFLPGASVHIVAVVVGVVLWTWQGYVFGTLHIRWVSYLYLLIFIGLFIKGRYISFRNIRIPSFRGLDPLLVALGTFGIFAQVFQYYDFGLKTPRGMVITAYNSSDHIWHASLIRELVNKFPPNEPGISGVLLKDYHFWFNLCTADLIRVFHIPLLQTQFIGMYTLASVLLAFVVYFLAKKIYDNKTYIRLLFFFVFFSGDASVWVLLLMRGNFDLSIGSIVNNGAKFIDSPAFSYSMIIGLTGLYMLFHFKEKVPKRYIFLVALLFGSLLEFKVYTGITFMLGLGALACYEAIKRRFSIGITFLLAAILGGLIFFPNLSSSGGMFYLPFAMPRDFLTQKVFGLTDWELRWQIYATHNNYLRLYQYGILMSVVYFISQFGLQLIGFFPYKHVRRILTYEKLIPLYVIAVSGFVLGTQFYQKVGGANIWEFFLPSGIILSILAALLLAVFFEKKNRYLRIIVFVLIFVIVIPRWFSTGIENFKGEYLSGFHGITNAEYASYMYLKNNVHPSEVVLAINTRYTTASPIAKVLTGQNFYLSGEGVRQQITTEITRRQKVIAEIKRGNLPNEIPILKRDHVRYIYVSGSDDFLPRQSRAYKIVFHNKAATIVKL